MGDFDPVETNARATDRLRIAMTAGFRKSGNHKTPVIIYDLSTDGFRIETYVGVRCGAVVWLTLPGLAAQEAEAIWVQGDYVGCKFLTPLHYAVLRTIADRTASRGTGTARAANG